ncbi:hypothetical protein F4781DRAFT_390170 [Annulohypoxylon bovei var. microspora]|nr:hypothetical protein F4781DRAFT_390170 [Annulohypoxylon bovei var. microspora]
MTDPPSPPWCEGYRDLHEQTDEVANRRMQVQWPWQGHATLPPAGDTGLPARRRGPPGRDVMFSHAVDVFVVVVRMLLSLGYRPYPENDDSPVFRCAFHDFGWDKNADYAVKGKLVSVLFPDEEDYAALGKELTVRRLFDHPEVKKALFCDYDFQLQDSLEFAGPKPALVAVEDEDEDDEGSHDPDEGPATVMKFVSDDDATVEHPPDADSSHVFWDGTGDLGDAVARQAFVVRPDPDDPEGRVRVRFAGLPIFVRVTYRPSGAGAPGFNQLRRLELTARQDGLDAEGPEAALENHTLFLAVVVRCQRDQAHPARADVRLYNVDQRVLPITECDKEFGDEAGDKLLPRAKWRLGDHDFEYVLFYCRPDDHPPPFVPGDKDNEFWIVYRNASSMSGSTSPSESPEVPGSAGSRQRAPASVARGGQGGKIPDLADLDKVLPPQSSEERTTQWIENNQGSPRGLAHEGRGRPQGPSPAQPRPQDQPPAQHRPGRGRGRDGGNVLELDDGTERAYAWTTPSSASRAEGRTDPYDVFQGDEEAGGAAGRGQGRTGRSGGRGGQSQGRWSQRRPPFHHF